MVRLQLPCASARPQPCALSIPLWCDCNSYSPQTTVSFSLLSIPLWCDCNRTKRYIAPPCSQLSIPLWCDCNQNKQKCTQTPPSPFNPTMVRLQHHKCSSHCSNRSTFNPTMVRLQHRLFDYVLGERTPFNPTMVRLQLHQHRQKIAQVHAFNPTMVRLQHTHPPPQVPSSKLSIPLWCDCNKTDSPSLNSTMLLSIPLWCDCNLHFILKQPSPLGSFNPTMVRLQLRKMIVFWLQSHHFQSHYGAIATIFFSNCRREGNELSIPLWCDCNLGCEIQQAERVSAFNPTMVRLQLVMKRLYDLSSWHFQSHYGAIATSLSPSRLHLATVFQSHYGAIATIGTFLCASGVCIMLSIPLWCDCNLDGMIG